MTKLSAVIDRGATGSKPASPTEGYLYYDTTLEKLQRYSGAAWEDCEPTGGGDATYTAAYGSRPAASNDGDLFLPSDGFVVERDTGAAWVPWGPMFPLTAPVSGDFSWVNQGSAAVSTTQGGVYLSAPAAAGTSYNLRVKSAPSTPYTITALVIPLVSLIDNAGIGLGFRQSSDGKLHLLRYYSYSVAATKYRFSSLKCSDTTTDVANYIEIDTSQAPYYFLRIGDDGTNRTMHWSFDGQNFIQFSSIGRTDYLTADQVGFFVCVRNATYPAGMLLLHWKEA